MSNVKRNCNNCDTEYMADTRNLRRGWGLCCSKACAAKYREKQKPGYNPDKVVENNIRRANWNNPKEMSFGVKMAKNYKRFGVEAPNVHGGSGIISGMTSEGYRVMDGVAYDEFDSPVYDVDGLGEYDDGDSEYWDDKD